jgi:hypothetical protein
VGLTSVRERQTPLSCWPADRALYQAKTGRNCDQRAGFARDALGRGLRTRPRRR